MNEREMIRRQIQVVLNQIQFLTRLLYNASDIHTRDLALQELWTQTSFLRFLLDLVDRELSPDGGLGNTPKQMAPGPASMALPTPSSAELPPVSPAQLAAATGRGGNPAWIAVGGVVYDVTSNAAWSAATHFGLSAGRDLTAEFGSCHAGRPGILDTLIAVGRLT